MNIFSRTAPALDELLMDVATVIELSDNDRRVAANRYGKLKEHLLRPTSALRPYLGDDDSSIYAQGSMAISATIISGTDDDRFDVDAIVDMAVPPHWSDAEVLDRLYDALQGFPDVQEFVRCTRCVQMRFAFMHMDVTVLDPEAEPRRERVGEIFHSPDVGAAYRVPSNPFGFSRWFRTSVTYPTREFQDALKARREQFGRDRLGGSRILADAQQEDLPPGVPSRLDAQQVIALKLMKRFINLRYCKRKDFKRPPSIYFSKLAVTCGYSAFGLTSQLELFAGHVANEMERALMIQEGPDERNPVYNDDCLNDRWPTTQIDRRTLHEEMLCLLEELKAAREADLTDIQAILGRLFGERVSTRSFEILDERTSPQATFRKGLAQRGTGSIISSAALAAPAIARSAVAVPTHDFHCSEGLAEEGDDIG